MPSITGNLVTSGLPDFRQGALWLRTVLVVNLAMVLSVFAANPDWAHALAGLAGIAILLEPLLLLNLAVLSLVSVWIPPLATEDRASGSSVAGATGNRCGAWFFCRHAVDAGRVGPHGDVVSYHDVFAAGLARSNGACAIPGLGRGTADGTDCADSPPFLVQYIKRSSWGDPRRP